ncbi:MAG: CRISPR-associated protein Csx16 [Desulfohalobiaceae bacterium]|nr:CRISPR-associated protein Csx16 [Desulfohalobiaceae bacterium]
MRRTLISFLGTGDYRETTYRWKGIGEYTGSYATAAIAKFWVPNRIIILATQQAKEKNGHGLSHAFKAEGLPQAEFRDLPDGRNEHELWEQFGIVRDILVQATNDEILLDITHGFRAQSFFSGAVLSVLQATGPRPPELRIVYGEYRGSGNISPVWDMSLFTDLMDWSRALDLFLKTGRAGPVSDLGREQQRTEAQRAKSLGDRDVPRFGGLISAIERFAYDLSTVRVAHIITGYEQNDAAKLKAQGSAAGVLNSIERHRCEAIERIPPLALILDRLAETVRPLIAERLWSEAGQKAQYNLAKLYRDLERYPETATVLREARVNLFAFDERGVEVNSSGFAMDRREQADAAFKNHDPRSREIIELRNELNHAGFRKQPNSGEKLAKRVKDIVERAADTTMVETVKEETLQDSPDTYFVSRHPGAAEWARQQGIQVDYWVTHLEEENIQPGDSVIGSLPVHLAGQVCACGGRYFHLSLDLPMEWRGKELSAEELQACNARLCEYHVIAFSERC